ncbi:hypothetical protein Snoj_07840 [Streptomyces nojiriensis]|uniref:CD225/dispanin family protein n=1 Tax=Streptomyces nojiriensis TaxID=66374 RepID=A0ABQ3SFG8_9ACTN|nr:hypothetical protein JYK04_06372 [Streptomyces nojiriensis]GHI66866.1 hypothetical protein Snoj_07840 [Streptomyces nojiriensis]
MADRQQPPPPEDENWGPATSWQDPLLPPQSPQSPPSPPPYQPPQAPPPQWHAGQPRAPETYLTGAILVTLFCFLPTGIAAIVFASQVSEKWKAGDAVGAAESARKARLWVIVSVVAGCLMWLLLIVIGLAADTSTTT